MKVARTVLRGGKPVRAYLSQLETLVVLTVNDEWKGEHSAWGVISQGRNSKD